MLWADLAEHKTPINLIDIIFASLGAFLVWRYLMEINFADKGVCFVERECLQTALAA